MAAVGLQLLGMEHTRGNFRAFLDSPRRAHKHQQAPGPRFRTPSAASLGTTSRSKATPTPHAARSSMPKRLWLTEIGPKGAMGVEVLSPAASLPSSPNDPLSPSLASSAPKTSLAVEVTAAPAAANELREAEEAAIHAEPDDGWVVDSEAEAEMAAEAADLAAAVEREAAELDAAGMREEIDALVQRRESLPAFENLLVPGEILVGTPEKPKLNAAENEIEDQTVELAAFGEELSFLSEQLAAGLAEEASELNYSHARAALDRLAVAAAPLPSMVPLPPTAPSYRQQVFASLQLTLISSFAMVAAVLWSGSSSAAHPSVSTNAGSVLAVQAAQDAAAQSEPPKPSLLRTVVAPFRVLTAVLWFSWSSAAGLVSPSAAAEVLLLVQVAERAAQDAAKQVDLVPEGPNPLVQRAAQLAAFRKSPRKKKTGGGSLSKNRGVVKAEGASANIAFREPNMSAKETAAAKKKKKDDAFHLQQWIARNQTNVQNQLNQQSPPQQQQQALQQPPAMLQNKVASAHAEAAFSDFSERYLHLCRYIEDSMTGAVNVDDGASEEAARERRRVLRERRAQKVRIGRL